MSSQFLAGAYQKLPFVSIFEKAQDERTIQKSSWQLHGWRTAVTASVGATLTVLILNVVILGWALSHGFETKDGIVTLFRGSCSRSQIIFTWSHLLINILGTVLFAASSVCMQCLMAPTREDVDRAHKRQSWIIIGILNPRNAYFVPGWRAVAASVLLISSIPLHLLYNSVIFSSDSAYNFSAFLVTPDFLEGAPYNDTMAKMTLPRSPYWEAMRTDEEVVLDRLRATSASLERLEHTECVNTYSDALVKTHSNFLMVTEDLVNVSSSVLGFYHHFLGTGQSQITFDNRIKWFCQPGTPLYKDCVFKQFANQTDTWTMLWTEDYRTPHPVNVQYCLATKTEESCEVLLSWKFLFVVIICNTLKLCCLMSAIVRFRSGEPLVTIGDAVASFSSNPDPTSDGSDSSLTTPWNKMSEARPWVCKRYFWFSAGTKLQWAITMICVAVLGAAIGLLQHGQHFNALPISNSRFGQVDLRFLIAFRKSLDYPLLSVVLIANTPQLLLSFLYLLHNNLLTRMLLVHEYLAFSTHPRPLRVSEITNTGFIQRRTHFLTIPLRYAVPFTAIMAILHWVVSQSIFLVRINVTSNTGLPAPQVPGLSNITTAGWSPLAIVVAIVLGVLLVLAMLGTGLRRYPAGMRMAIAGQSSTISAACQHTSQVEKKSGEDETGALLQYGAMEDWDDQSRRRAGFSTGRVTPLVQGILYTGT